MPKRRDDTFAFFALQRAFTRGSLAHVPVDLQYGFFSSHLRGAFERVAELADVCRSADVPNIWVSMDIPPKDARFHIVRPRPDEKVHIKKGINGMTGGLHRHFRGDGVDTLLVSGVDADSCVRAFVSNAVARDYTVLAVMDAMGTDPAENMTSDTRKLFGRKGNRVIPITTAQAVNWLGALQLAS